MSYYMWPRLYLDWPFLDATAGEAFPTTHGRQGKLSVKGSICTVGGKPTVFVLCRFCLACRILLDE